MTQHVTKMWEIALDETAGMRYSVYVSGKSPLAYYSPAGNDRVLQPHICESDILQYYSPAGNDRVLQQAPCAINFFLKL